MQNEYGRIIVMTDEENPVTIATITDEDIVLADGYRVIEDESALIITTDGDALVVSISKNDIIEVDGYKAICVPLAD